MKKKEICTYFLQGRCKHGNNCHYLHEIPQGNPQPSNHIPQPCKYFLTNSCNKTKEECHYFHGFGGCLLHIKTIKKNNENINNLIRMDDTKFISSEEKGFIISFIQNEEQKEQPFLMEKEGYKIGKMIFSSNKAIFALRREGK
jgi:flavoprotein